MGFVFYNFLIQSIILYVSKSLYLEFFLQNFEVFGSSKFQFTSKKISQILVGLLLILLYYIVLNIYQIILQRNFHFKMGAFTIKVILLFVTLTFSFGKISIDMKLEEGNQKDVNNSVPAECCGKMSRKYYKTFHKHFMYAIYFIEIFYYSIRRIKIRLQNFYLIM